MYSKTVIAEQAKHHDCFYLYDESKILQSIETMKQTFPQVTFLYSLKCNPNPHVIRSVFSQGFGADAASLGEVLLSKEAGLTKDQIYYSAPGKTTAELREGMKYAHLIADSLPEIERIDKLSAEQGVVTEIGVRINPDVAFYGGKALPSKSGVDEDQFFAFLKENNCKHIRITGIHAHLKSQVLDAAALASYQKNILALAERVQEACGRELAYVNLGSGVGIPFASNESPMDMSVLQASAKEYFDAFLAAHPNTKLFIETGRYTVGKSGVYVTKVVDKKVSCGVKYAILKNTFNGFVRPSIGVMVGKYNDDPIAIEPMFTCKDAFQILTLKEADTPVEKVTLVGNLCTAADVIAEDIELPELDFDDVIIITNAGAYAAVVSPMQFSLHTKPAELFLRTDGTIIE